MTPAFLEDMEPSPKKLREHVNRLTDRFNTNNKERRILVPLLSFRRITTVA
jgi:hypothetical protein